MAAEVPGMQQRNALGQHHAPHCRMHRERPIPHKQRNRPCTMHSMTTHHPMTMHPCKHLCGTDGLFHQLLVHLAAAHQRPRLRQLVQPLQTQKGQQLM